MLARRCLGLPDDTATAELSQNIMTSENPKWIEEDRPAQARFRAVAKSFAGETTDEQPVDITLREQIIQIRDRNLAMRNVPDGIGKVMSTLPGLDHIHLEPLSPSIGTVVHGIDCATISSTEVAAIRALWLSRKVIFFRNQGHLTHEQHLDFARKFGEIGGTHGELENEPDSEITGKKGSKTAPHPEGYPMIQAIYSQGKTPFAVSNWHSDVTFAQRPPIGSLLLCRAAPKVGGDTMFCDAYQACIQYLSRL